jgi:hypothetical protein
MVGRRQVVASRVREHLEMIITDLQAEARGAAGEPRRRRTLRRAVTR